MVIGFVKAEAPDLVVLTNVLLEHCQLGKKIVSLTNRLGEETGLLWFGLSSPNSHACLGGTILLYTERISSLHVDHLLPFGSLMALSGTWGDSAFTILSIQWNLNDDEPRNTSLDDHKAWRVQMLWGLINDFIKDRPTVLCGDFGMCREALDLRLLSDTPLARRIPFRGPHLTEIYSTTTPQLALGLDHIVSNRTGGITGRLVSSEGLPDGHLPIVIDMDPLCFLSSSHLSPKARSNRSPPTSPDICGTRRSLSEFRPQDHTMSDPPNDAIGPHTIATPTRGGPALNNAI